MTISSRTPEGQPGQCPLCGAKVALEPSLFFGDAPCPQCGTLLWFCRLPEGVSFFAAEAAEAKRRRLRVKIAELLGVAPDEAAELTGEQLQALTSADSIETVELIMELAEEDDAEF